MRQAVAIWNYAWDAGTLPACIHEFADYGFDAISFHPQQFAGSMVQHLPAVAEALRSRKLVATVHGSCAMDRDLAKTVFESIHGHLYAFTLDSVMRVECPSGIASAPCLAGWWRCICTTTTARGISTGTSVLARSRFPKSRRA